MPSWIHLYFQDGCSFVMEQLVFFHDHVMMVLLVVMMFVGYLLLYSSSMIYYSSVFISAHLLEGVWTMVPILLLLMIAFPSLRVLYVMEEMGNSSLNVKVIGHQWYWSYEYSDFLLEEFDSYMVSEFSLFRLLDVSNMVVFPANIVVRTAISSVDVIHSWAIPAAGLSMDAIPGRLNQVTVLFNRVGLFVGQCSEICGLNHSFMPVVSCVVPCKSFFEML